MMYTPNHQDSYKVLELQLSSADKSHLEHLVATIHQECPSQIQSRYLSRIGTLSIQLKSTHLAQIFYGNPNKPIHITNLPHFDNIEQTKILLLLIGETIGRCIRFQGRFYSLS